MYKYIDRKWRFQHKINDPQGFDGSFGWAVVMDGLNIVVGSPGRGNGGGVAVVGCE